MPAQNVPLQLTATTSPSRIRQVGDARLINCRPEKIEGGRSQFALFPRSGLRPVTTLGKSAGMRGLFEVDESRAYALAGNDLYQISRTGIASLLGNIPGTQPAFFARNRRPATQVACVTAGSAFLIQSSGITRMSIPSPGSGFVSPIDVCFIDGYLVFVTRVGQMHFTGIDNATELSALNYLTAEGNPDGLWRCINRKREVWLFGDRSTEIWVTSGDIDQPFQRLGGGYIETGILAPNSLQHTSDRIVWVDDNFRVKSVSSGYQDQRISTSPLERLIENDDNPRGLRSMSYVQAGNEYYVISGTDWTWVHDFGTGTWQEWSTEGYGRWRAEGAVTFAERVFCGDLSTSQIYQIREDAFTDGDRPIVMTVRLPTVSAFPSALSFFDVRVDVTTGVGSTDMASPSADIEPELRLRWSDDGGARWSPYRTKRLGAAGAAPIRVSYNNLGQSKDAGRMLEFSMSAGVDRSIVAASALVGQVSRP